LEFAKIRLGLGNVQVGEIVFGLVQIYKVRNKVSYECEEREDKNCQYPNFSFEILAY